MPIASSVPETRDRFTPARVLIASDGEAVSPGRTTVRPDVIFVRKDGWTLGAPAALIADARRMWAAEWIEEWHLREDGHWEKVWPCSADGSVVADPSMTVRVRSLADLTWQDALIIELKSVIDRVEAGERIAGVTLTRLMGLFGEYEAWHGKAGKDGQR